jgi:vitamin B12/bleomycin/antimicrobial peptide transport system ATP-binding/permease protein
MIDRTKEIASATTDIEDTARAPIGPQIDMMVRALWGSRVRGTLFVLWGGLLVVLGATAYGQIELNRWNAPFYDALAHRQFHGFVAQLGYFVVIAGGLLVLNVAQRWLTEMLTLKLRDGLVHDLVRNWMSDRRAFRLAHAGPIGENPDQRMHEDARHLTELSATLGIGLLQAGMLLVIFVVVLWSLSRGFSLQLAGHSLAIPGYMVWAAVLYAFSASLLSYFVGRPLINQNTERYAREADLRSTMVRVNEHIDAVALSGGEAIEERRIETELARVLVAMRHLVGGLTALTWITAGYGWFTLVAPILAAAPQYFNGALSFGGLMMAAGAFNQVQSSLRWFVDNYSTIADWRATLLRVANFRRAVLSTDELHGGERRIEYVEGEPGRIEIDDLAIASPAVCLKLKETKVEVRAAERLLIVGQAGLGETVLFRALAGLWPWGAGRIVRAPSEPILYVPRAPYVPAGALRDLLAYPDSADSFAPEAFVAALRDLGLERLVPRLAEVQYWDRELSGDDQHALGFARVVLHAPPWVFVDDLLHTLEPDTLARVVKACETRLARTGIIRIARNATHDPFHSRVVHLLEDSAVQPLPRTRVAPATPGRLLAVGQ